MINSWLPNFIDLVFFGILIFLNYAVWINKEIYNKYINYYLEKSDSSDMVKRGAWRELIGSPHFIWFPRTVFLIALGVHAYFVATNI